MTRSRDKSGRRRYEDYENESNKGSESDPDWQKEGLEYYKCEKCLRKFTRKCSYLRHQKDAIDCRLARERDFDENDDFPNHKRARKDQNTSRFPETDESDDSEDDWPVKCILCEKPFKSADELSKHIDEDHNDDNENSAPPDPPPPRRREPKRPKEAKAAETKPVKEDFSEMIDFEVPLAKYSQVPIRMPKKFQKAKIRAKEIDMEFGSEEKPKIAPPKFKISVKDTKGAVTSPSKKPLENENKSPAKRSPTERKPTTSPTMEDEGEFSGAENNNESSTVDYEEQTEKGVKSPVGENDKENKELDGVVSEQGCDNEQESAEKALAEAASFLDDIDLNVTKTNPKVAIDEEDINLDDFFDARRSLPSPPPPPVPQPTPVSSAFLSHAHTYAKSSLARTSLKDLIKRRPKKMNFVGGAPKFGQPSPLRLALNNPNAQVRFDATNLLNAALANNKPLPRLIRPLMAIGATKTNNMPSQSQPQTTQTTNQGSTPNLSNVNRKVYQAAPRGVIKVGDTLITRKSLPQIISNEILPPNHNLLKGINLATLNTNKTINLSSGNIYLNTAAGSSPVVVVRNESPRASTPNQMQINRPINVLSGNSSVNYSSSPNQMIINRPSNVLSGNSSVHYSTPSPVSRNESVIVNAVNRSPVVSQIVNQKPGVVVLRTPSAISQGALPNITLRNNAVVHNETPTYSPTALQPPPLSALVSSSPQTQTQQYFTNTFNRTVHSISGNNTPYSTASPIFYYGNNTVQSQPQRVTQFYHNQGNGYTQIRPAPPSYTASSTSPQPSNTSYVYTPVYNSPTNITVRNPSPNVIVRNTNQNVIVREVPQNATIRKIAPRKIVATGTASIPTYGNIHQPSQDNNAPVQVVLKLVRCPNCPKTFATKSGLRHHFKKNHTEQPVSLPPAPTPPQYSEPTEIIEIDESDDRYSPEKSYLPPVSSPMERPQYGYSNNQQVTPQPTTPLSNMPSQPLENSTPHQDHAYAYQRQIKNPSPQNSPSALVDAEEYIQKLILSKQKLAPQFQNNENVPLTTETIYSNPQIVQNSLNEQNAIQPVANPATPRYGIETASRANDDVIETIVID